MLIFVCAPCVQSSARAASPYGHLKDVAIDFRTDKSVINTYYKSNDLQTPYLIYKVIGKKPIRVCTRVGAEESKFITDRELSLQVSFAMDIWLNNVESEINKAGRREEFKDFSMKTKTVFTQADPSYPIEIAGVKVIDTDTEGQRCDVTVMYDNANCLTQNTSYFNAQPYPHICLNFNNAVNIKRDYGSAQAKAKIIEDMKTTAFNDSTVSLILHELGHAFGLADQYKNGRWNSDILYSSISPRVSVMSADSHFITCDDMDGIISLFYRAKKQDKSFKSFCKDGLTIKNGKPAITKLTQKFIPARHGTKSEGLLCTFTPDSIEKDTYTCEKVFKFDISDEVDKYALISIGFDVSYFNPGNAYVKVVKIKDDIITMQLLQYPKGQEIQVQSKDAKMTPPAEKPRNLVASYGSEKIEYKTIANMMDSKPAIKPLP